MKRSRASAKDAGTRWESSVAEYLCQWWPWVERRARTGAKDTGDIAGMEVVIECKNTAAVTLAAWVAEANVEAINARPQALGVVWAKRRGKSSPADGYVICDGATFVALMARAQSVGASPGRGRSPAGR